MTSQSQPFGRLLLVGCLAAALAIPAIAAGQTPLLNDQQVLRDPSAASGDFVGEVVAISGSGNTLAVGAPRSGSTVYWPAAEGAVYVHERNPATGAWAQQARLTLGSLIGYPQVEDHFGAALAISEDGNTLVVGAPHRQLNAYTYGDAYVLQRTGSTWRFVQTLNSSWIDTFGTSVAMRGSTIVVGAPHGGSGNLLNAGAAFVFRRNGGGWNVTAKLNGNDEQTDDDFGAAVAIDEDENTVVVGAPGESEPDNGCSNGNPAFGCRRGAAYVFEFNTSSGQWDGQAKLTASPFKGGLEFGRAVSISANFVAVGAPGDHSLNPQIGGAVHVFQGPAFAQTATLVPSTSESLDEFGSSVAIWGWNLVAGAPRADFACPFNPNADCDSGTALLFQRNGAVWSESVRLAARDATSGRHLGASVSLIGTSVAIGAPTPNTGAIGSEWSGRAYVYSLGGGPDLVETFVSDPPPAAEIGDTFSASDTAENRGSMNAGSTTTTRYFLSADGRKHGMDGYLGAWRRVGALSAGSASTGAAAGLLRVPSVKSGSYKLLACGDDTYVNVETDESNNCIASTGTVLISGADVLVSVVSNPPASAMLGSSFDITDTVVNNGSIATPSTSVVQYFLSADRVRDASDVAFFRTRAVGLLSPGNSSTGTVTLTIPSMPAGTLFVLACADGLNAIPETDETNNCRATAAIRLSGADLEIVAISNPPVSLTTGTSFSITDTIRNNGSYTPTPSITRYFLSLDRTFDSADLLSGGRDVNPVSVDGSTGSATLKVPAAAAGGRYFVIGCADELDAIVETDETNNCFASTGTVLVSAPDLVETAVTSPPAAAVIGSSFSIADNVANQGTGAAASFVIRYYLSSNSVRESSDTLVGSRTVGSLAAGTSSSATVTIALPSMPSGSFHVIACADDLAGVVESNESNNCRASTTAMTVTGPDLVVTSLTNPPSVGFHSDRFMVIDTVSNQGDATAAVPSAVLYYLSPDRVRGGAEWLIGGRTAGPIAVGGGSASGVLVTIPENVPAGAYYVLACADDLRMVVEQNESNNCRASANPISIFVIRF